MHHVLKAKPERDFFDGYSRVVAQMFSKYMRGHCACAMQKNLRLRPHTNIFRHPALLAEVRKYVFAFSNYLGILVDNFAGIFSLRIR